MLSAIGTRLRRQDGMSLAEVLIVSFLFVVVLGAALAPFEAMLKVDRKTHEQNDSQRNARGTAAAIVFNLRNLAGQSQLVERADPYDLVFETVDRKPKPAGSQNARNIMRVRYCLNTTAPAASPANAQIWEQTVRWTTAAVPAAMPSSASCPDIFWAGSERRVLSAGVTNRINSQNRSLFAYYPAGATLTEITSIRFDSYTDMDSTDAVKESRVTTGVLLRNQNGAPTASVATTNTGSTRQVRLDATASDPESLPLTYRWCDLTGNAVCDDVTRIGSGQSYTYTFPAGTSGTTRSMRLVVSDAGGLEVFVPFNVLVPA